MDKEDFFDNWSHISCKDCKYYSCKDDCYCKKRLDHKKYRMAQPWFVTVYDYDFHICSEFEATDRYPWLYNNWKKEFTENYYSDELMGIIINGNRDIRYMVRVKDYFYNTLFDENGELKWVKKMYYKKSKSSPIGYELIREFPDGTKVNHD